MVINHLLTGMILQVPPIKTTPEPRMFLISPLLIDKQVAKNKQFNRAVYFLVGVVLMIKETSETTHGLFWLVVNMDPYDELFP